MRGDAWRCVAWAWYGQSVTTVDNPAADNRFRVAELAWPGHYEIRDYGTPEGGRPYTTGYGYSGFGAEDAAVRDCAQLNRGEIQPSPAWYQKAAHR